MKKTDKKPTIMEVNQRLTSAITDCNAAFNSIHLILSKMGAALEKLEKLESLGTFKAPNQMDGQLRQFCAQAAALACQVQGGDVVKLASQIEDYVLGYPDNVVVLKKDTKH